MDFQGGGEVSEEEATQWWKQQPAYQGEPLSAYERSGILMTPDKPLQDINSPMMGIAKAVGDYFQRHPQRDDPGDQGHYLQPQDEHYDQWAATKLGMDVEAAQGSGIYEFDGNYYVLPTQMYGQRTDPVGMFHNQGVFLGGPFNELDQAQDWEKYFLGYGGH